VDAPHNVKLVVDVAILRDGSVLLARYRRAGDVDGQPGLFLPNDQLVDREDPGDAVARVLREQLGIGQGQPRIAFAESFNGQDRTWHLALHYVVDLEAEIVLAPSDKLASAEWFRLDALPPRREVAHGGWALRTLERALGARIPATA
jgi:ADP-ribose pyrophosphatase YjhB (NUDIX family)